MTEEELQTRVITNLKTIRKQKGLSQERLADKADISRQMMNDIEGRRRWLTKSTLVKLCNALEIDVSQLFMPVATESSNTETIYMAITQDIVSKVKNAVDETLNNFKY